MSARDRSGEAGETPRSGSTAGESPVAKGDAPKPNPETPDIELLPCPFCGGRKVGERGDDGYVSCMDCHAYGPENGVKAWNTRLRTLPALSEADVARAICQAEAKRHYGIDRGADEAWTAATDYARAALAVSLEQLKEK